jgi:hypothetical protein
MIPGLKMGGQVTSTRLEQPFSMSTAISPILKDFLRMCIGYWMDHML